MGADGQRYFDGVNWTESHAAAPVKKRLLWPWILAGVLLLFVGGCGTFLFVHRSSISAIIAGSDIGVPIDDGSFRFVVHGVGRASLQSGPQPAGVYFIADVAVTNTGTEPRSFEARNQTLIDARGRTYAAMGMDVVSAKQETMTTVVNPGQVIEVAMRFDVAMRPDVPTERAVVAIVLHESATSAGTKARLF